MKKDFTQWKDDYGLEFEPNYTKETELDCMAAFKAGQQSKQAEINELKREMLNKTNEAYAGGQKSMRKMIKSNEDELQKRINEALSCEDKCTWNIALVELKKILKGNTNDH